jgi:hypothetical protein
MRSGAAQQSHYSVAFQKKSKKDMAIPARRRSRETAPDRDSSAFWPHALLRGNEEEVLPPGQRAVGERLLAFAGDFDDVVAVGGVADDKGDAALRGATMTGSCGWTAADAAGLAAGGVHAIPREAISAN